MLSCKIIMSVFILIYSRSVSHDDPKIESEVENCSGAGGEINFRRSQSNDNFQTKIVPPGELGTTTVNDIEPVRKPSLFCLFAVCLSALTCDCIRSI